MSRPRRPWWQRIVYPIIGAILIVGGVLGCIFPIVPGIPFLIFGIPLLFCFNARWEERSRGWIRNVLERIRTAFHRWRMRHH
jgi:uncharacterized membrane protein YbaN (DUF454 family)